MSKLNDNFTMDGAIALAARIKQLWHAKGHFEVHTWIEPLKMKLGDRDKQVTLYQVRSNLFNALPPQKVAVAA